MSKNPVVPFRRFVPVLVFLSLAFPPVAFSQEDNLDPDDAAEKARRAHELAGSDMIYQQEDFKALYYQNVQMIQLLKEIRDSLNVIKTRGESKNAEEKTA